MTIAIINKELCMAVIDQNDQKFNQKLENRKWYSLEEAICKRKLLREKGKRLVITNGCFDLLHAGHLVYLKKSAALGDELWIVVNSDKSVRLLKGLKRPIQGEEERMFALSCLEFVSGMVLFDTERLDKEIMALQPDVYTKAGDYTLEKLDKMERKALETVGTEIVFMPFVEGYSTTRLIQKIIDVETKGVQ